VVYALREEVDRVEMTRGVLARASQPYPTSLGTLDALHLATALIWKKSIDEELLLATHDEVLARAAEASGMVAVGV
jgi:DhnA family fructose-bisphosphate aldolase class Ia